MDTVEDRTARLLEAGLALSAELSLPALLQRIVEIAAELTDARYGALGVLGADGQLVDFLTTGVTADERAAIGALPHGGGILGVLIRDARSLRLHDIADDPRSVGFPPNHPPMRTFLGAPVRAHGQVFGNLYLTERRDGRDFSAEDEQVLTVLATQAGVAVANARLYEEARLRERWLDAVRETSSAILSGRDADDVLRLVARRARELVGADVASIAVPDRETGELTVAASDGAGSETIEGMTVPRESSLSGAVISSGERIVVGNASEDSRGYGPMVGTGPMGPALFVPLSMRGRPFGTLSVANLVGGPRFGEAQIRLLETFADQAALGLEHARAQRELGRLALIEDRERIAKDLHDGVIQALFAVGLSLEGASLMLTDERASQRIQEAVNEIDRVIGDLRNYIFGLRPAVLADRHLGEALDQLGHEFETRTGITTVVEHDDTLETSLADRAAELVQIVREALSNVGRHAGAQTCRVSLRREDGAAVLEIDDDGRGFDTAAVGPGLGLPNLRQRAAAVGGALTVDSSSGAGTTINVRLPL